MRNFQQVFRHRFGPLAVLAMIIFALSFITRLVLLIKSWPNLELTFLRFLGIFFIGFFYDLVVCSFFAIPVALYCWLMKDTWYQKKWQRIPLFFLFFIITLILVLNVGGEIIFWDEFNVRYNFIAVDYLIYTTEVIGNIIESYNIPLIASAVIAATILILFSIWNKLTASQDTSMRFGKRTGYFLLFMLVPAAGYFGVNNRLKNTSSNNYVNELGGNGIYEFGAAFWNNEIDFNRFYATGTRTVRGLEALSLAIPPTPGQSIVRRPENKGMFTIGHVLRSKGYDVNFIYGGNSFFDNMGEYFSNNSYGVLDKSDMPDSLVQLTTAWGVDDGATFDFTIQQCDKSFSNGKPFFNHIMTVSNHRPYMYPEGKIDISPTHQSIEGAVKYTDYAIHKFIKDAQKKAWFSNTLFVIVADHCSKSAGKTDLPVNRYHIPCIIYAPQLIKPSIESRLVSQVDLDPTLLGLMNMNYTSRFLGYDIYKLPAGNERAFISTYQDLGYMKNGRLVILSPQKKIRMFSVNITTGLNTLISTSDSLADEAIAWYQGASFLYHNGKFQK